MTKSLKKNKINKINKPAPIKVEKENWEQVYIPYTPKMVLASLTILGNTRKTLQKQY